MAPKHHPTPLSGGDRKALNKELGKSRPMTNILAAQSADTSQGRDHAAAGRPTALRKLERADVERRRTDRPVADHRPGHQRRLCMARDPVFPLQDAERRRPGRYEASADHLRPRPRQPATMPEMRQGWTAP